MTHRSAACVRGVHEGCTGRAHMKDDDGTLCECRCHESADFEPTDSDG